VIIGSFTKLRNEQSAKTDKFNRFNFDSAENVTDRSPQLLNAYASISSTEAGMATVRKKKHLLNADSPIFLS
jgi:hypothetical protein